jgi:predicted amidohydrolase
MPELDGDNVYNTSFVFDRSGREIARHRKVHLFDIDIKGRQRFMESETFAAGDSITVFDTEFGRMGLLICFDIRFPEICRLMALKGANVLFVPAAFGMITGPMHWELLFRLRAVDNQVFTVGASPARDEKGVYVAYGNSIAVDPWGKILCRAGAQEAMEVVQLDLSEIEKAREQLPLISAMRNDVYQTSEAPRTTMHPV